MEFSVKHSDGIFEIITSGATELGIYGEFLDALLALDQWRPGALILVDESALDTSLLTVKDVQEIAEMCGARRAKLGPAKCALVVGRDLEFGMVRMWGVYVEEKWDVTANLFESRAEAIAWLKA